MKFIKNMHQKKLSFFLISIIVLAFGVVGIVFFQYRHMSEKNRSLVSTVENKANVSIGRAHQTATRDGIKEWSLDAASADYMDKKNQAIFKDLSLTFFLKDNSEVYLTADRGILKTDSNDMEINGNVVVTNSGYKLRCENLYYAHEKRIISSKVPVKIIGDSFELVADSMSLYLNTNRVSFDGKVKGNFRGGIAL